MANPIGMRTIAVSTLLTILLTQHVVASFLAKTDNEIVALDLTTGKVLWSHKPDRLSTAHFEVYKQGLVVYPHYDGKSKTDPLVLDLNTGIPIPPFRTDSPPLAKSAIFGLWPEDKLLINGWVLEGFSAGSTKTLTFVDQETKAKVWSIETGGYPHKVRCWQNFVFYAFSYLSDEGVLYAYQAGGDKASWTVDLNQIVKGRKRPLTRMIFQIIENVLYLEANEHVFAIDPKSGTIHWHRDLSEDLNLPFYGGFYRGGLNLAVFAKAGDILVISFEKRVLALDLKTMKYLWHLEPDTFPGCPFPAVHDGKVFLSTGRNRHLYRVNGAKEASNRAAPTDP